MDGKNLEDLVYCVCGVPILVQVAVFFGPAHRCIVWYASSSCSAYVPLYSSLNWHLDRKSMRTSLQDVLSSESLEIYKVALIRTRAERVCLFEQCD
jgi:hypothetical protein